MLSIRSLVFGVASTMLVSCGKHDHQQLASAIDARTHATYVAYVQGSFAEATNTLVKYIEFLQQHKSQFSIYRDVDTLLYTAHLKLASMLLHSGNEKAAAENLKAAYDRHALMQQRSGLRPVLPSEFVDFALAGVEAVDAETGTAWKLGLETKSNRIEVLKQLFEAEQQVEKVPE